MSVPNSAKGVFKSRVGLMIGATACGFVAATLGLGIEALNLQGAAIIRLERELAAARAETREALRKADLAERASHTAARDLAQSGLRADLAAVRALSRALETRLDKAQDDVTRAVLLRDMIYRRVRLDRYGPLPQPGAVFQTFNDAVVTGRIGYWCQGLAVTYRVALEAHGIPARQVGMFPSTVDPEDSHSSVEVMLNGRWVAMDPTFNVALRDGRGRLLSWAEARTELLAGRKVADDPGGMTQWPQRRVADYPTPLKDLLAYLIVYPARGAEGDSGSGLHLPRDWDGVVRTKSGAWHSSMAFDATARQLSRGPMR